MASTHEPVWKKGICGICPAGCWVEVALDNGRLVDIRADRDHPLGMICRRGRHAPEIVYSEHRIRYPMKRTGPKGQRAFERITWDEAYDIIVGALQQIKRESGPEAVAIYTGRGAFELSLCDLLKPREAAVSSASGILFPFGSPNTMGVGALCYVSFAMIAPHVTMGRMLIDMFFDIEHAEVILVWGANPATDSPPLDMYRLEAAARRGARIYVIDPRRTETVDRTGAKWVPIRPGTDGALALGLIHVMLEEDGHDETFARTWCHGFNELQRYVQHFRPEVVESITGVPSETVRELARVVYRASGACPVMYTGLEYSNSGIQAIRAVLTFFALAGHLDVPGGIGLAMPDSHFPINQACNPSNPALDRAIGADRFPLYTRYRAECHASALVDSVLRGDPYRIRGLIIHGASILTSWPQTSIWRETLAKLDFLVCIDRQWTADMDYADVVLPATTMFEILSYMVYGPIFRIRERIIPPVGESRNDYLIMVELAQRLGYGDRFPQSEEAMLRYVLKGSGYTLEQIREAGGWVTKSASVMEYRKWEKGRLRSDGQPGFETPTGKFEIYSTILEEYGYDPLPVYQDPWEGPRNRPEVARQYPLILTTGSRLHVAFRSQHHGIPGLVKDAPEPEATMHPDDARARGIEDGDLVEIRTLRGAVPFRVSVTDRIMKGVVECNMGGGTPVGPEPWQRWNVNELTDLSNVDPISGFPVFKALLCEVVRTEGEKRVAVREASSADALEAEHFYLQVNAPGCDRNVYLDNNATTPMLEPVRKAVFDAMERYYGNPSSIHNVGREARFAIEEARRRVARLLNTRPRRLVFTGGGSAADNLAIKGVAFALREKGRHIITTPIEHPAVLQTCRFLERIGFEVTYLPVDRYGRVNPEDLEGALRDDTILVSIMMANNEVGTVQPIRELVALAHERGVLFHTDAVQAVGKIPVDVEALDVDLLSFSAHKFHGPKGIGGLYVREGVPLEPLVHGGKQEWGMRAGTENIPGIVGLGKAAELAREHLRHLNELRALRERLESGILEIIPEARLNGHPHERLPNTVNVTIPGIRGESLVLALDQRGIAISSGSACKSGSPEPTHVLLAMGCTAEEAHCAIRLSLSYRTTKEDIDYTLEALQHVLREMKSTIRFLPCK